MKYIINIFLVIALSFFAISCEKQGTATGNSTVGFKSTEFNTGLGSEWLYVPIELIGETSQYPVTVKLEVGSYAGDFAAVDGKDFIVTSTDMVIPNAEANVAVEIKILNRLVDELRFVLKIVSQTNAQGISNESITINAKKTAFDRLTGDYAIAGTLLNLTVAGGNPTPATWDITVNTSKPNLEFAVSGFMGEAGLVFVINYDKDKQNVEFPLGANNIGGVVNFTNGARKVALVGYASGFVMNAIPGTFSSDYSEFNFEFGNIALGFGLYTDEDNPVFTEYVWTGEFMSAFTFKKVVNPTPAIQNFKVNTPPTFDYITPFAPKVLKQNGKEYKFYKVAE